MKAHPYIAEAAGTFALVFAGCGAIVVDQLYGGVLGHAGVSMVFGLVVMAMIYSVGNISGAHINPAVTLGFVFAGRLDKGQIIRYVSSQIGGAVFAALVLWALSRSTIRSVRHFRRVLSGRHLRWK